MLKMTMMKIVFQTSRGELCQRNSVLPNWSFSHYVHSCLGQVKKIKMRGVQCETQGVPDVVLRKASDHSIVFQLEDNALLNEKWPKYRI